MNDTRRLVDAHRRFIEARLRKRWPAATQVSWEQQDEGFALRFMVNGLLYGVGFKMEYLEDEGTDALLEAILNDVKRLAKQ